MKREQKKFQGEINKEYPHLGWDPAGDAFRCIENIRKAIDKCAVTDAMAGTGCAFGNAEAAFYEKQIDEDEMDTIKSDASELRSDFISKCKCEKR
jgi:hypothetical protein